MPLDRLRPCAHPYQRHGPSIPVDVAGLEVAHLLAAPRRTHLLACAVEIAGIDEFERAMPDHLLGPITQDGQGTRADLNEIALGVANQNQILRGLEDAPPLLDLLIKCPLGSFALADVARHL